VPRTGLARRLRKKGNEKYHFPADCLSDKTLSFTIVAWVGNIGQIQNLKSEILRLMYLKLKEKGIKTV
jgi:hypothetical protein